MQCFQKMSCIFAWRAQHFGDLLRHFAWQAQHFRRALLRVFCESHCQGCVKWWQRANRLAGVGHGESVILRGRGSIWCRSVVCGMSCCMADALHSTLYTPNYTLYTLNSTLYTPHSTLYTPHSKLHTLHSTLYTLHFTLHSLHLHSTLYTLHSTLHTLHFTLRTIHSAIDTSHSTL